NDGLVLFPDDDVWIDAIAVEAGEDADAALEAAGVGPLVPDLLYEEWTIEPRNRLRLRQLELLRSAGRWEQVLNLDSADEGAHLALMKRDLARGEREAVLRRFELLDEVLQSELGIVPSKSAVALRDRALTTSPAGGSGAGHLTRTFVMTDLAGSTQRWEDEPQTMAEVLANHDELLIGAFTEHGGDVFKHTGDGLCVAFESATSAVHAAIEAQRRLQSAQWPIGNRPQVRIGIDTGEAQPRDGDWFGRPLNRAARVMDAGSSDQILCSHSVAELASIDAESGAELIELGLFRLAGLAPLLLFRLTAADLVTASAPPRSMRVGGQPLQPLRTVTFGREEVRGELARALERDRLVTLTGPGGAGKTHLARHVGSELLDRFIGGAWFCGLGSVDGDAAAAQAVLSAIGGIQHGSASVVDSIITTLGERQVLLLVDNCEHVIGGIGPLLDQIVTACPGVAVLATSREPLGVAGERVHRIEPLDRAAAIDLFVSEAGRHGQPIDAADPVVARICDRLDDLPMAVRLAAARARSLDLVTLESLLADRFEFLTDREAGGLAHQQTLRTTIAWSVNALDAPVRAFLIALGAFAEHFD
ncbi:MAG: adenylate/guanylate cyclase domain-containing protein, partial [Actinomycetota bacterium]